MLISKYDLGFQRCEDLLVKSQARKWKRKGGKLTRGTWPAHQSVFVGQHWHAACFRNAKRWIRYYYQRVLLLCMSYASDEQNIVKYFNYKLQNVALVLGNNFSMPITFSISVKCHTLINFCRFHQIFINKGYFLQPKLWPNVLSILHMVYKFAFCIACQY